MSLRRKIALWLCPELGGPVGEPAVPFPHAQHMGSAIHKGERIIPAADNKACMVVTGYRPSAEEFAKSPPNYSAGL